MGVLNVTADSFSDGGHWLDFDAAVSHGIDLLEACLLYTSDAAD